MTVAEQCAGRRGRLNPIAKRAMLLVAVIVYAMAFQGSRGLWERDEGRYANIAVQMLRSGNFLIPAFNDDVPHFAKPPLTYWAVAAGIRLLGQNEWGARLANALAFIGTLLVLFELGKTITPKRPWLPPLVYGSSLLPFGAANFLTTDTLLTLWEALGVLGFVRWRSRSGQCRSALFLMWSGFALAFLTKGPPGLLPLPGIAAWIILQDGWRGLGRIVTAGGVVVFIVLGLGWYLIVVAMNPALAEYFLRDEVLHRVASGASFNRNAAWYGALAVYLPTLIGGMLPWTFILLRATRSAPRTLLSPSWWKEKLVKEPWLLFALLWLMIPLLVFFLSRSRLPLYLLPLFVPLALVTSRMAVARPFRRSSARLIVIWLVVLVAVKWGVSKYPYPGDSRRMAQAITETFSPRPSDLVFVDAYPVWGLGFYLNCEVEQVLSGREPTPMETLEEELSSSEPGSLLVVKKGEKRRLMGLLARLGHGARDLAEIDTWSFIAPTAEFARRPARSTAELKPEDVQDPERGAPPGPSRPVSLASTVAPAHALPFRTPNPGREPPTDDRGAPISIIR